MKYEEKVEKTIIEEYSNLIKLDEKYQKEYKNEQNFLEAILESDYIWRKITDKNDIAKLLKETEGMELLRIEDYYADELCEINEKENPESDFTFDEQDILKMLNDNKSSQRLKECIKIMLKSSSVCKMIYETYYK